MSVLIIGGSSQLAHYVALENLNTHPDENLLLTFRSPTSFEERRNQLALSSDKTYKIIPIFKDVLNSNEINFLISKYSVRTIFFLSAVNIPTTINEESAKSAMHQIHIQANRNLLESLKVNPEVSGIFTLSSKMFQQKGERDTRISLDTKPSPENYYGATKLYAWNEIMRYREKYNIIACAAILFNFESEYRLGKFSDEFVIHKIADDLVKIMRYPRTEFSIKNFFSRSDWSHASDIAMSVFRMGHIALGKDFVIGSGRGISLRDIVVDALNQIGDNELKELCLAKITNKYRFQPCLIADNHESARILGFKNTIHVSRVIAKRVLSLPP